MSDSYGALDRIRYHRIGREYGYGIANLHYDVFDTGSSFGPMVIPRMGRAKRANADLALECIKKLKE
jgi:S-formylglutathione hydrolase FrmB